MSDSIKKYHEMVENGEISPNMINKINKFKMSKKLLTEDLILDKMEEKGIAEPGSIDTPEMQEIVLDYYDAEIKTNWGTADMYFFEQSTADGYEIYIATENERNPYWDEDVYYYESEWLEKLPDCIKNGMTIQLDDHWHEDYQFEDAINECYEDYWNDKKEEVEEELIEEGYEKK